MKKLLVLSLLLLAGCSTNDKEPIFDPEQFIGFCALFSVVFGMLMAGIILWLVKIESKIRGK